MSRTANCGWHTRGVSQSPDPKGPDEPCVLLKLGEIVLKGRNRQQFERILQGNIRNAARDTGVPIDLRQREGVILLRIADGEQRGPRAVNGHGKKKSPDRRSGIDNGGDVAGHRALTPGEEGKRESVVEQRNSDEPGQQAARRQLVATETEHNPEQGRPQRAA